MRSATSKTTSMLCVITTMPSPWSRSLPDELEHLRGLAHAERGRRLVEDHELGVPERRARDRDGLSLAAGQRAHAAAQAVDRRDLEVAHAVARVFLHLMLGEDPHRVRQRPRLGELAAEIEVRDDVEVVAQRQVLVDGLDPEPVGVARVADRHLAALEAVAPAVGRLRAGDGLDQRGLAGAVVAHQRDDLARVDLEVDVDERLDGAEALRDPDALEQRRRAQWRTSVGGLGSGRDGHGNTVPHGARARIGARPRAACARIPAPHP